MTGKKIMGKSYSAGGGGFSLEPFGPSKGSIETVVRNILTDLKVRVK